MRKPDDAGAGAQADSFRLDDFVPFRLTVAADAVSRLITRLHLAKSGLNMAEWRLLATVGRFGVVSPTMAGEEATMDKVKVSRAAAALVSRGLVRQTADPNDGRGRLLRLTRKGASVYAEVAPTAQEIEDTLMAGLTKAEWQTLRRALVKMSNHADAVVFGAVGDGIA